MSPRFVRLAAAFAIAAASIFGAATAASAAPSDSEARNALTYSVDTAGQTAVDSADPTVQVGRCDGPYGNFRFDCVILTPSTLIVYCYDGSMKVGSLPVGTYSVHGYCRFGVRSSVVY